MFLYHQIVYILHLIKKCFNKKSVKIRRMPLNTNLNYLMIFNVSSKKSASRSRQHFIMLFKRETNILVIFNSDKFQTYFDFDLSTMIMYPPPPTPGMLLMWV